MQILCERSNTGSDVRCTVCGQGFLVYWPKTSSTERGQAWQQVLQTLRTHHGDEMSGHHAHPEHRFSVLSRSGDSIFSAPTMLGGAMLKPA